MQEKILLLDNIRSAYNVGSLFRTADGAGVSSIVLIGYTPTPVDRFGREQSEIKKTSLGASETISWISKKDEEVEEYVVSLKASGVRVVALEQTSTSVSLYDFEVPDKVAYILGNEIDGVSKKLLTLADTHVAIPMRGQKESLNVSVAGGIALFHERYKKSAS